MSDLLIINPMAAHGVYGPLGDELIAVEPPLWCRLIAGYVRDRGFTVEILDAEALGLTATQTADRVSAFHVRPRLICIAVYGHQPSASTQQMWGAGLLAKELKRYSNTPIIMVGGHPSALPERTLREEAIDYVGVGEGPMTLAAMLGESFMEGAMIGNVQKIPGLAWRLGNTININLRAPLIEDLGELHGDAWGLLPMERYRAHNWQCFSDLSKRKPYASIYTSLGCPFKCSFCCINSPFDSNRYRMRKPADVVDEVEYLHEEFGVSTIKITDEMFVLNERHYTAICDGLIQRGLGPKLNIWAYARVDTVRPETLKLLRAAGIQWLALGIESGSKFVRDGAQKKLKNDDIVGVVRAIQNAGINVIGNFLLGLFDDSMETMEQTFQLAAECNCEFMNVYSAQAYPGSALYSQALKDGWDLPKTWSGFSQHNRHTRPIDTRYIGGREVLRFRDEFFERYFKLPSYRNMVVNKFGGGTLKHIDCMLEYKLKRDFLEVQDEVAGAAFLGEG